MEVSLPVLNDFSGHGLARRAFERSLVVVLFVEFDPSKPHQRAAAVTLRALDFGSVWKKI